MKSRFILLGVFASILIGMTALFVSCKNEVNVIVQYVGKVVYKGTTTPFPNLEVKITNGGKIHAVSHTDDYGSFTLSAIIDEIDGSYYVLIGDSSCVTRRIELSGYGQAKIDLGTIEIEGPALPTVTTKQVSDVSDTKATCGGNVTADGRSSITARGVCWSKAEYPTVDNDHTTNGSGLGEFKSQITGIEAGATYYVRAYATNKQGTAYGNQVTFSTSTGLPLVTTDDVSNISANTATCGGNVAANSGYIITARGICWSDKTATPTINNDHTEEVANTGHFSSIMLGLAPNVTYYVRAYAENEKGINYGETKTFKTFNGLPSISTIFIGENVTETTAISGGQISDDSGYPVIERGVCWNTMPSPNINNNKTIDGSGIGNYYSEITGIDLTGANTYYVRAYATNENGTAYGNEVVLNKQNLEYKNLPRIDVDGYIYVLFHDIGEMFYYEAVQEVESMTFAGYNDWMLVPSSDQMRYIMVTLLDGWKDSWGNPVIVYTKENPSPTSDFPCAGYYWISDSGCIDGYQMTVYCEPAEMYDWTTYTAYNATSSVPYCSHVSSNRNRVRPMRRYRKY